MSARDDIEDGMAKRLGNYHQSFFLFFSFLFFFFNMPFTNV